MHSLPKDAKAATLQDIATRRTKMPPNLNIRRELGRGSNNRVLAAEWNGAPCVVRVPRRRSDTQQRDNALVEFRCTLRASQLKVGPEVHTAWSARHASGEWPSGLYLVEERFPDDLEKCMYEAQHRDTMLERRDEVTAEIVRCLHTLAREGILAYDLKPSNVVVRLGEETTEVRIIDFGRDFCEWAHDGAELSTPVTDYLRKRIRVRSPDLNASQTDALVEHILFATMMVILSATTTRRLHHDKSEHRMCAAEREDVHPLARTVSTLLNGMQGQNVCLVRDVLRLDEVRGVLRHYHGRRSSGTHRTLALACGEEVD